MDNITPMIVSAAEEAKNAARRLTVKMNEDDPDEETKQTPQKLGGPPGS